MRALAFALLLAGCKDKSAPPPSAPAPATQPSLALPADAGAPPAEAAPAAAAPAAEHPAPQPISIDDAVAALPKLDGDVMIAPKTTADGRQAHATWCLAGTSADAVAESLSKTMAAAGWTDLTSRGDAKKAGVSGERDGYRLSYVVSASSAASCREPGHYFASATLFKMK